MAIQKSLLYSIEKRFEYVLNSVTNNSFTPFLPVALNNYLTNVDIWWLKIVVSADYKQ